MSGQTVLLEKGFCPFDCITVFTSASVCMRSSGKLQNLDCRVEVQRTCDRHVSSNEDAPSALNVPVSSAEIPPLTAPL